MNQVQLAKKCRVSNKTISKIENGKGNPSGELAYRIAVVLGFNMNRFYQDEGKGDVKNVG